jgi:4-coumarate--CoA ligase
MKGYLNRPEENTKFFAEDGFFHTGDLAHYDENGVLYFEGRLKELIKYKNCHLYPLEIENVITTHPDIIEAAVFGKPDPTVQELVTAAVVKIPGSKVTEQDIIDIVAKNVDDAKQLRGGVIFVEQLPKNPQGKIQRRKLIESFAKSENLN